MEAASDSPLKVLLENVKRCAEKITSGDKKIHELKVFDISFTSKFVPTTIGS